MLNPRDFFRNYFAYIIIAVLYGLYAHQKSLAGAHVFYILLGIVFVIHLGIRLSPRPAEFTAKDRKIIFTDYCEKHVPIRAGKNRKPLFNKKPVIIRVRDIQELNYSSNLIERIFNLGNICIDGKVFLRDMDDTACHDVYAPDVIEISGIKDFRAVCRELETAFPQADHSGIKY